MELKWLEDFISLATTRNFSRAAEDRGVTQPAFSRRIKALEQWVGAPLVDRSSYPAALTPAGAAFRSAIEDVVRQIHAARDEARGHHRHRRGVVSFVALHTLALTFFPGWLTRVERGAGRIGARLVADNLHDCVQALLAGGADFMLGYAHSALAVWADPERNPSKVIGHDAVLPVCLPTADGRPRWRLDEAEAPIPFLGYTPDTFLGRVVELALRRGPASGLPLDLRYENAMAEALKTAALAGLGLAWLPLTAVADDLASGRLVPAGGEAWQVSFEIRLWRGGDLSRPLLRAVWDHADSA